MSISSHMRSNGSTALAMRRSPSGLKLKLRSSRSRTPAPAPSRKAVSWAMSASRMSSPRLSSGWPMPAPIMPGARGELPATLGVEQQHVGFQRLEAALAPLARGGFEIVERAHRRPIDHLAVEEIGTAGAQNPATRPIDRHAVAHRPAEKLVDRNTERLAADVEAGVLDGGNGVGREPARGRPRTGAKRGV